MASRFWRGGNGSWSQTAHWSTTSGGAGGASVPGVDDIAIVDNNSGSPTISIDVAVSVYLLRLGTNNASVWTLSNGSESPVTFKGLSTQGLSTVLSLGDNAVWTFVKYSDTDADNILDIGGTPSILGAGATFIIDFSSYTGTPIGTQPDITFNSTEIGTLTIENMIIKGNGSGNYWVLFRKVTNSGDWAFGTFETQNPPLKVTWFDHVTFPSAQDVQVAIDTLKMSGTQDRHITLGIEDDGGGEDPEPTDTAGVFTIGLANVAYVDVSWNNASGSPTVFDPGGVDNGNNTNWMFSPSGTGTDPDVGDPIGESGLPNYQTSLLSAVSRVEQDSAHQRFVYGGRNNDGDYVLFKKSEVYGFHVWRSPVYQIGKRFDVMRINLNVATSVYEGVQIVPKLYFDNERVISTGTVINATTYPNDVKRISLGPRNFDGAVRGKTNFFFELQLLGTELATIALPIEIEIEEYES